MSDLLGALNCGSGTASGCLLLSGSHTMLLLLRYPSLLDLFC